MQFDCTGNSFQKLFNGHQPSRSAARRTGAIGRVGQRDRHLRNRELPTHISTHGVLYPIKNITEHRNSLFNLGLFRVLEKSKNHRR